MVRSIDLFPSEITIQQHRGGAGMGCGLAVVGVYLSNWLVRPRV